MLTEAQIRDALQAASTLETEAISGGLDIAHDPPTATYLIGYAGGKYVAIPVVLGLSDGHHQEIIAGLSVGQQVVSGQRNPFLAEKVDDERERAIRMARDAGSGEARSA